MRAFFALPPMTTRAGQPTSGIYGLCVLLLKLLREEQPRGLAFARDAPSATFRHIAFPQYKAQRAPLSDPLRAQFPLLTRLLDAFELPVFVEPGFEADDVLATLTRELRASDEQVRIVSGDRDMLQLARDGVDVLFIGRRAQESVVYDEAAVTKRFSLRPSQLPSLTALVGDASDNLPKVPGVGQRTAEKLIGRFGDASGVLAHLDEITPVGVREALRGARDQVLQTESLARLRDDVALPEGPRFGRLSATARSRLRGLFGELEFKSLIDRLEKLP
jgi:DNA polymerase-1